MVSFGQILLIIFLAMLLFGDLPGIIKKLARLIKKAPELSEGNTTKKDKD
jgi:Sec-independent protein translocase protein TatA